MGWVSDDDQLLWLYAKKDTDNRNMLWFKRLDDLKAAPTAVQTDWKRAPAMGKLNETVWLKTNWQAPKQRVMKMTPIARLGRMGEVIPERDEVLRSASSWMQLLVAFSKTHAVAERLTLDGKPLGKLELPGMGSVWGLGGYADDPEVFYVYSDFVRPSSIYRLDMKTGQSSLYRRRSSPLTALSTRAARSSLRAKMGPRCPCSSSTRRAPCRT